MSSVAVLVDGSNMCATLKALGFNVDWRKVFDSINADIPIHRAMYFTAMKPKEETSSIRPLIDFLEHNGWAVIQKPIGRYVDDYGRHKIKGNMDVEITVAAMQLQDKVTDVVLFTGDGDFEALVRALQNKGIRVTVVSTRKVRPNVMSELLLRACDVFIDLADMRPAIERLPTGVKTIS